VLLVTPGLAVNSVQDLIALAKAKPGVLNYASAGPGSLTHLAGALFEKMANVRMTHVPYRGTGQSVLDIMEGRIEILFGTIAPSLPHIRAGKLRALAVTQSTPLLPGVPTFAQAGFPVDVFTSFSVVAPAGTPDAVLARLGAEIARAMRSGPIAEKLEAQALVPVFDTPAEFAASLKKERDGWAAFIRRNNIEASD